MVEIASLQLVAFVRENGSDGMISGAEQEVGIGAEQASDDFQDSLNPRALTEISDLKTTRIQSVGA
jgi:hypothetical protein